MRMAAYIIPRKDLSKEQIKALDLYFQDAPSSHTTFTVVEQVEVDE